MSRAKALPAPKRAKSEPAPNPQMEPMAHEIHRLEHVLLGAAEHASNVGKSIEAALLIHARLTGLHEDGADPLPVEDVLEIGQHLRLAYADFFWLNLELGRLETKEEEATAK